MGPCGDTAVGEGQEEPVPGGAPLGKWGTRRDPAGGGGKRLRRDGGAVYGWGEWGIGVPGKRRGDRRWVPGKRGGGTDAGLERPGRLLPAAGHVPGARAAEEAGPEGAGPRRAPEPPGGLRFRPRRPSQSERAGSTGPRPHTRPGTGVTDADTDTGHRHSTDRLLSAMDVSER